MNQRDEQPQKLQITAITVADAAKVLASAYGRRVTEQQVRDVAEAGGLLRSGADDTINLLEYMAFLIREMAQGPRPPEAPASELPPPESRNPSNHD